MHESRIDSLNELTNVLVTVKTPLSSSRNAGWKLEVGGAGTSRSQGGETYEGFKESQLYSNR